MRRTWPSYKGSTEYLQCDLKVEDSTFRRISVELLPGGALWVWLPWNLDLANRGGSIHEVTWESFGTSGLN